MQPQLLNPLLRAGPDLPVAGLGLVGHLQHAVGPEGAANDLLGADAKGHDDPEHPAPVRQAEAAPELQQLLIARNHPHLQFGSAVASSRAARPSPSQSAQWKRPSSSCSSSSKAAAAAVLSCSGLASRPRAIRAWRRLPGSFWSGSVPRR
jgi:hypothetical protein